MLPPLQEMHRPLVGGLQQAANFAFEEDVLVLFCPCSPPLPILQPDRLEAEVAEEAVLHGPVARPYDRLYVQCDLGLLVKHVDAVWSTLLVALHPELPPQALRDPTKMIKPHHDLVVQARGVKLVHLEAVRVVARGLPDGGRRHAQVLVLQLHRAEHVEELQEGHAVLRRRAVEDLRQECLEVIADLLDQTQRAERPRDVDE
mmetsp:Transcript_18385/g.49913  ORF Transcript_18385/g.49913 Transcript_18385/m.49913 type:complete len:202 (-) Transcript_18385:45-650(-)